MRVCACVCRRVCVWVCYCHIGHGPCGNVERVQLEIPFSSHIKVYFEVYLRKGKGGGRGQELRQDAQMKGNGKSTRRKDIVR
jgi:hypothetical protein